MRSRQAAIIKFLTLTLLFSNLITVESHAAETLVVKTIQDSPLMPVASMSYATIPNPNGSGVIESYTSPTGLPMLSQIEFGFWDSTAGVENQSKYAWADVYSPSFLDTLKLPFPSPNRISIYRALIYNDSLVLYHFNHPIITPIGFSFCLTSPNTTFSKADAGFFGQYYDAGYSKCSEVPSIESYMKQFIVRQIPLKEYSKFQVATDYENYSVQLAQASKEIFAAFFDQSKADNYSFKYTGHGAGQGGLFEHRIWEADAHQLLKSVVSINGNHKFAFIDFSTNCDESSVRTLDQVTPYADYVIASEFARGGYRTTCQSSLEECWSHDHFEHSDIALLFFFNHTRTIKDSLISILKLKENEFYTNRIGINTQANENGFIYMPRQSVTLVDSSRYSILKELLQVNYDQNPIDFSSLVSTVSVSAADNKETGVYDLGTFAKNLGAQTYNAFTQTVTAYARSYSDQPLLWDANGITFHMMQGVVKKWAFDKSDFTSEKNARDKAIADKALADKAAADAAKEIADKAFADKAAADAAKEIADKAIADKAIADKALADKAIADAAKAAADKAIADAAKAASDKALADKAIATPKKVSITCVKGKLIKKVTAVKPSCPSGYKKKK
ncbi:MAG: hypothetical protein NTZ91_04785 [Actinobacteria bacterium]|nr:hypothetical protein [Actinomycetota bacterium]